MTEDLRYPVGPFVRKTSLTAAERAALIEEIAGAPAALQSALRGLDGARLDTPYRPGGWTVRQVAHHLADSHMNAFIRFRLGLTEEQPTIKPYDEKAWATLVNSRTLDPEVSLRLLEPLHERFVTLLRGVSDGEWGRTLHHPESGRLDLDAILQIYAWHGRHHVAHINALRARQGW